MTKANQLTIEFTAIPENVPLARVAIAAFAAQLDFTIDDLEEVKVLVSEAVGNAIIHGYHGAPGATVKIKVMLVDQTLTIQVEDSGRGIEDIAQAMEAGYSTDPERMGLGFVFMKSFTEDMRVDSSPGRGTRVTLIKRAVANQEAAPTVQ